jgi:hypothetical protein
MGSAGIELLPPPVVDGRMLAKEVEEAKMLDVRGEIWPLRAWRGASRAMILTMVTQNSGPQARKCQEILTRWTRRAGAMIQWSPLRAWIVFRLNPNGKHRFGQPLHRHLLVAG